MRKLRDVWQNSGLFHVLGFSLLFLLASARLIAQQTQSQADLDYQFTYQRDVEAVIWAIPAMADVFVREALPMPNPSRCGSFSSHL